MNYSNDEILKAVKIIHDICDETRNCSKCCFSNDIGDCLIHGYDPPFSWKLSKPDSTIWKALF